MGEFDEIWERRRAERDEVMSEFAKLLAKVREAQYEAELVTWWPSEVARWSDEQWERFEVGMSRAWEVGEQAQKSLRQMWFDTRFRLIISGWDDDKGDDQR